jgi:multidrug efflux pump subunit AcrA (membrane-fusion protein)
MVTITQLNPINVQFTVPETYMASLLQLQKSPTGLVVQVQLGNGQKKQGKVFVVDNQVDPSIGAVKVKASLDNSDYALAPGRFVTVTLQTQILKNSLVVPSQAIISSPVSDQIYTVDEENQEERCHEPTQNSVPPDEEYPDSEQDQTAANSEQQQ